MLEWKGGSMASPDVARALKTTQSSLYHFLRYDARRLFRSEQVGLSHPVWVRTNVPLPPDLIDWSKHRFWKPWVREGDPNPPHKLGL